MFAPLVCLEVNKASAHRSGNLYPLRCAQALTLEVARACAVSPYVPVAVICRRASLECIFVHRLFVPLETKAGSSGDDFAVVRHQGFGEDGPGQVEILRPGCGW